MDAPSRARLALPLRGMRLRYARYGSELAHVAVIWRWDGAGTQAVMLQLGILDTAYHAVCEAYL